MKKNFSVNMVNTRSAKEQKTKESAVEGPTAPSVEIDLETPDQSVDEMQRKTMESTPIPNVEEQEKKTIEFSPIDTVDDTTSNPPETIKDDSQAKRTSFIERIAAMVGMKPREKEEVVRTNEKIKTFGTVSAITTEAKNDDEQVKIGATANNEKHLAKLEQIDKKLKCSEEDRQMLKQEIRYNKNEKLDNCFNLAKATEENLQQISEKVEANDKESERHIKKDMQEKKQRYETVNKKLWNLETRMDTMSRDQAESSCAIQSKLDALLRNSTAQEKLVTERPQGTRVDFIEPQRNKRESTPLPRIAASTGAGGSKTFMKGGSSNTTNAPEVSSTNTNVALTP